VGAPSTWQPPAAPTSIAPPPPGAIWMPPHQGVARPRLRKILMNIIGTSGVGKSFLVSQALEDPDYGPDEVAVIMHEDGTESYGPLMKLDNLFAVTTPETAKETLDRLIEGANRGYRLPKLLFYDSLTGMTDHFQSDKETNPNMIMARDKDGKPTGEWVRDKRSEYGDMGRWAQLLYLILRDQIPMDIIVLITSYEGAFNAMPEIACEGKVIPKNITRWSSCTLYMKAIEGKATPEEVAAEVAEGAPKHRSYGRNTDGSYTGAFISRYFTTQNTGEIMAKGHRNLFLQERAILPDVLRKIRGTPVAAAPAVAQ
jgi:hypothetical protein